MKFVVVTYGCQMNERDTDTVSSLLIRDGYAPASDEEEADIVLVNTCSVRGKAEEKALGKLRLLVASKRRWEKRLVGAMGCMVQRMGKELLERVPGLDFGVGPRRLSKVPEILRRVCAGERPILDVDEEEENPEIYSFHAAKGVSAFVNILLGCNRKCSYCIVPFVRGKEISRPASEIMREVKRLVAEGVKEVTLLGQSVMSYGQCQDVWQSDLPFPREYTEPFPRLLWLLNQIPGLERIRFTSGHPSGCTDQLVKAMRELPKVCEHLHLPLQSGSDRILERMGRGYTVAEYSQAVERLRTTIPNVAITTDIIVGFPMETVEEFEMTRAVVKQIGFDSAFIFKYSPRPGTLAARFPDDVPWEEKLRRNKILLADQQELSRAINRSLIGQVVEVLVEGKSRRNPARWTGRTRTNKIVVFAPAPESRLGELVGVRIQDATAQTLYGRLETYL
ncbi:MAG: tRNA (N6-isopentenyl adenosine(37)-C2)-methylthiotransferase MiaB [Kiritimatiellia bacterium]